MKITIQTKLNKNLTKSEKNLINEYRKKEFGKDEVRDFKKDYEPDTVWMFLKDSNEIVSLLGLRPIEIKYLKRNYKIRGICSVISIKKKRAYGRVLIAGLISYLKSTGESALGFTGKTKFFEKAGLVAEKDLIKRFVYVNPDTGEKIYDNDGDGIYYNGEDNFMNKIIDTKSKARISVPYW